MGHGSKQGAHIFEGVIRNHITNTLKGGGADPQVLNLKTDPQAKVVGIKGILTETAVVSLAPHNHAGIAHLITTLLAANLEASQLAGRSQTMFYTNLCAQG